MLETKSVVATMASPKSGGLGCVFSSRLRYVVGFMLASRPRVLSPAHGQAKRVPLAQTNPRESGRGVAVMLGNSADAQCSRIDGQFVERTFEVVALPVRCPTDRERSRARGESAVDRLRGLERPIHVELRRRAIDDC